VRGETELRLWLMRTAIGRPSDGCTLQA
jgi:hypothetical protein